MTERKHYWNEKEMRRAFSDARNAVREITSPRSSDRSFALWVVGMTEQIFRENDLLPRKSKDVVAGSEVLK